MEVDVIKKEDLPNVMNMILKSIFLPYLNRIWTIVAFLPEIVTLLITYQ